MSSIDKYVEGEARSCNPNVRVKKEGGRIVGYIGDKKVFDIADRYGYLNENERTIIISSIRAYEEEQREKVRREQIRLENERIGARTRLKRSIESSRNAVIDSYNGAMRLYSEVARGTRLSSKIEKLKGYNLSGYEKRIRAIEQKVRACEDAIKRDYQMQLAEIDSFEHSIRDDATTQEYIDRKNKLQRIRTNVVVPTFPVDEINQLDEELDKLADALERVNEIELQLRRVSPEGLVGAIAQNALRMIHRQKIGSLADVDRLLIKLQEETEKIKNVEFESITQERADQIRILDGIAKSCYQLRSYIVEQDYEVASYRNEIVETAHRVLSVYSELRMSEYTTCTEQRMSEVYEVIQEVLIGTKDDEQTLVILRGLLDEGEKYLRDDSLQSENYADYRRKVAELINRGYPIEDIEAFDPFHYEEQSQRLNDLLLQQDIAEAASRTKTTFLMACKAMEDMGYSMLYYDVGSTEDDKEALACEAIYVIPGCEGVVWKLIASDCSISRKLVGVQRPSGACTTVSRIREVAEQIEYDGEIDTYYNSYAEADGGQLDVISAVDTATEGSDRAIMDNGCFVLSEEGEEYYDKLVANATEEQKSNWETKVPKNSHSIEVTANKGSNEREEESKRCYARVKKAREKK